MVFSTALLNSCLMSLLRNYRSEEIIDSHKTRKNSAEITLLYNKFTSGAFLNKTRSIQEKTHQNRRTFSLK
jgi:hypothetical protein